MTATTTLTLVDGVRIVVPDSLQLITPYVLREQGDWFEDEIRFLRRLLRPGQRIVDIGANHGAYALSMARAVGPRGRVWAFEPASSTADLLARSIEANGFRHVTLLRSAVSDAPGTGRLALDAQSELNALVHDEAAAGRWESVPLVTLDDARREHGWDAIDFLKIDAEGEEGRILEGGARFFAELSPLVQYEVRAARDWHVDLVHRFVELGYRSYRLVPGLDLLVPFDPGAPIDGYLLNLFCCKPDRARALAQAGFLVEAPADVSSTESPALRALVQRARGILDYDWRHQLATWPYGAQLRDAWAATSAGGSARDVEDALALYAMSGDAQVAHADRLAALQAAGTLLRAACAASPPRLRQASLARVAAAAGERALAVDGLKHLLEAILQTGRMELGEPFLAPIERFDAIPPGERLGDWVLAAVAEAYERLGSFSSYYAPADAARRLDLIHDIGFGGEEMARRRDLFAQRRHPPGT